ncbi:MAG: glycosyltransferase [Chitinispirillia bacterium]|nr:glycosyltransferase [Chitinispirillia bacterium]
MARKKILIVSYSDAGGGAFIAAKRILDAMLAANMDVKMGVVEKRTNSEAVFELPKNPDFEMQNAKRNRKNLLQTTNPISHSIGKLSKIDVDYLNQSDFNVINLHWVAASTISIEDIAKIKKTVVWTMHDTWPFCGAEHYPNVLENDTRFIDGYTKENFPETSSGIDICRITWIRKKKAWKGKNFHFVALCNKEKECLQRSALFKNNNCTVIPNPIPSFFRKINAIELKKYLGIPLGKKIIGFGAIRSGGVKGSDYLIKALAKLKNKEALHTVIFGDMQSELLNNVKIQNTVLGTIFNDKILALIYNCMDCFVCPSLIETFCQTAHEAMHCGVPVAGFDVMGVSECIEHKKTGYLAKPFDADDLARGIEFCLANQEDLSQRSVERANSDYFSAKQIANNYMDICKKL